MILESINRKVIVPMVEKTAQLISFFKIGSESIKVNDHGRTDFVDIDDDIRNSNYTYRYGDRKATFERKSKFKEMFDIMTNFVQVEEVANRINWLECFKFALEQYGVENSNNFLKDTEENNIISDLKKTFT